MQLYLFNHMVIALMSMTLMYPYGQSAYEISSEHARGVKASEFFPIGLKALWLGILGSD